MAAVIPKTSWADDSDELPAPEIIQNADGTKTVISYRINPDSGRKVRVTQKIREIKTTEKVGHAVAERKKWAKYGQEKQAPPGPNVNTTSVGEENRFRLTLKKLSSEEDKKAEAEEAKEVADAATGPAIKGIKCRLCGGGHMTMKCPYKDVLGNDSAADNAPSAAGAAPGGAPPSIGSTGSSYIAPHLRGRPIGAADPGRSIGLQERDDSATLRVSNLSEEVTEADLRAYFSRLGRLTRCHVVRDFNTGRNRGFAFISYDLKEHAEEAVRVLDGRPLDHMIMKVEFSKKQD